MLSVAEQPVEAIMPARNRRLILVPLALMLLVTAALYPLMWDLELSRGDGVILLFALVAIVGPYLV